ncbi:hypothetical protein WICANDRAFT_32231 [Wickerhamomyces anomalus NRRL Y-366-8]|uniref:AB hydrolase-1 domain-containing protein n=1 Tax=Wickerhamomyces anomalus (strain ATCC 58044 / CBS 1984 / NCYC 433 / NRRL Y-366-8) TaxID=683960 RepID=A0A1E3P345_WICAA|nr:uncharacterized protein WICANDRAFT_32231 [Wickerhamomyces anomalus NRRL Y-366-8]ODQ59307.1 hypothetical protein WICANDRAFT_32231 [Wickerhamomyces anomalus NRRL Y-366-8]
MSASTAQPQVEPPYSPTEKAYTYKDSFRHWWNKSNLTKSEEDVLSLLPFYPDTDGKRVAIVENVPIDSKNHIHEFNIRNVELEKDGSVNEDDHVVLIHGYGAALGFFYKNFDSITEKKGINLHALDLLGYGLSSRPKLPKFKEVSLDDVTRVEEFFIDSIEKWRAKKQIDKFKLIGHSFGGYLSSLYTLKYPEHVSKLILISPVGVERSAFDLSENPTNKPQSSPSVAVEGPDIEQEVGIHRQKTDEPINDMPTSSIHKIDENGYVQRLPNLPKFLSFLWEHHISPFTALRVLGPLGPHMSANWSFRRFGSTIDDPSEVMKLHIYSYNTFVAKGSGEHALTRVLAPGALARHPLLNRLPKNLKVDSLFLYGDKDWMSKEAGHTLVNEINKEGLAKSDYGVISNAGHHVYLDNPQDFKDSVYKFFGW